MVRQRSRNRSVSLKRKQTDYKKWNSSLLSGSAFIRGMHQVSPDNDQNIMNDSARIQNMSRGALCGISVSVFFPFCFIYFNYNNQM